MAGRIYISSAFKSLSYAQCKPNEEWLDNDPHFWKSPPTWGICRTDYRKTCNVGDYVFFVLPKRSSAKIQCIYGYIKVLKKITHAEAYVEFPNKRMGNKNPNGNIIVDKLGNYNTFDNYVHFNNFDWIKKYYLVGDANNSRLLDEAEINVLSESFNSALNRIFKTKSKSNFEIISRKGRVLTNNQVKELLLWIKS
jgi:hypothetical protein